ncbi:hypothetical protein [Clostridium sp.]|uniref:hypothetical protein n=1 Tax=Clostridium sp. TaxID=1506 RepID=UPI002FC795E9
MLNNIKAILFHLIYTFLSLIFTVWLVSTGPSLGKFTTSVPGRIFFILLFIMVYICLGMLLCSNKPKKYDFFFGSLIALVGIVIWLFTFLKTGMNTGVITKEYGEYWLLFNLFFSPFNSIYFFLDISITPIILLLSTVFPSLLMGIGLKLKRRINISTPGGKLKE